MKEFKKDVADAVEPLVKSKGKKSKGKVPPQFAAAAKKKKPTKRSEYASMSATQLRKFLSEKKKALLIKSGFPNGALPRAKADMVNLCLKLKRKRW